MGRKKIYIGLDITNEYTQICYKDSSMTSPKSFSTIIGGESFFIPTVLCNRYDNASWTYGTEAIKTVEDGEGFLVDNLLNKALNKEDVEIGDDVYHAGDLLIYFTKKLVRLVSKNYELEDIVLGIVLRHIDREIYDFFKSEFVKAGYSKENIHITDYQESTFYFVVNQDKNIWSQKVILFDFLEGHFYLYEFNRYMFSGEKYFEVLEKDADELFGENASLDDEDLSYFDSLFSEVLVKVIGSDSVSGIYLTGGFNNNYWMRESKRVLCKGRKAFVGESIFALGACYFALCSNLSGGIYAGKHKLQGSIFLNSSDLKDGLQLCEIGRCIYEGVKEQDVIAIDEYKISFQVYTVGKRVADTKEFEIQGAGHSPGFKTRLRISLDFIDEKNVVLHFKDLGFGDFSVSNLLEWQEEISF
ncbi:hypothetical protein SAMN05216249_107136 [Acetitomaculum ruminis DSM 5522]|uniref:DUF5716 domain-containing protein n=1 Tax=Acetitomaculum ruminis DSM 5522 TaxID=1120918 RepID=A0A1I0XSN4_9FIRM|nr:DUF5716 family protein [Acetitomaculum ruminis]SFB04149.1 hypothetical protein SAMN05216249_107136 [Acetitomaculum ruminis DSM 5522]